MQHKRHRHVHPKTSATPNIKRQNNLCDTPKLDNLVGEELGGGWEGGQQDPSEQLVVHGGGQPVRGQVVRGLLPPVLLPNHLKGCFHGCEQGEQVGGKVRILEMTKRLNRIVIRSSPGI